MNSLHQIIDILSPPIINTQIIWIIFRRLTCLIHCIRIRWHRLIKIIIKYQPINVIIIYYLHQYIHRVILNISIPRIQKRRRCSCIDNPAILNLTCIRSIIRYPIWINPSMNLYSSLMSLLQYKSKWIITRIQTSRPRQRMSPWLIRRLIHRIPMTTYLEHYCVDISLNQGIQHRRKLSLLCCYLNRISCLCDLSSWKINTAPCCRNPYRPKIPF